MSTDFDGQPIELNYLYKCPEEKCGRYFWHRNVLREFNLKNPSSLESIEKEKEICVGLEIPEGTDDNYFVYVIKLNKKEGDNKDSVYVGETNHHPLKRYLQHLRGYIKNREVTKRGYYLWKIESGYKTREAVKRREKELAEELRENYIVYGGH
jgi:hypothetical protein